MIEVGTSTLNLTCEESHRRTLKIKHEVSSVTQTTPAAPVAPNCETSKLSSNRPSDSHERPQLKGQRRRGAHTGPRLRRLGDADGVAAPSRGLAELHGGRGDGEPPPSAPRGGGGGGRGEGAGGGGERGAGPRDGD